MPAAVRAEAENIPFEPDPGNAGVEKINMNIRIVCAVAAVSGLAAVAKAAPVAVSAELPVGNSMDSAAVVNLPSVEIVANRATSKTPIAFTNISKAQLAVANDGRDVPYLLAATPSLITTSDAGGGMGYTSMRVRGTDGTRINVTVNGVPINNPESHRVYWVNMPDLASSLKDIQVQRGAGTSTNGSAAFGASVNMLTDLPSDEAYANLSGAYGSYNSHREALRVGSGLIKDHWSFDARISHLGSDGYIDRATSDLWSYFGQAAYTSPSTTVRLVAFGGKEETYMAWDYASKEDMEKYGRRYNPCGLYIDSDGNRAFYPDQKDRYTQHHFQLLLYQRLTDALRLNVALHYTKDFGYYTQLKTNRTLVEYGLHPFTGEDGQTVKKSDLVREKYLANRFGGGTFSLNYNKNNLDVVLGGGINRFDGDHYGFVTWVRNYVGPIDPKQRYYDFTGRKTDANIYLRGNYDLTSNLSVFADLQMRHIHYTIDGGADYWDYELNAPAPLAFCRNWNFFNPKAGINFERDAHRAFASWSVAHKEPTADNFVNAKPHEYPTAERLFDYELGYTYSHRLFTLGVNLYYMDYRNQLVLTGQLSDTGNPQSTNVHSSYRMGVEFQSMLKPVKWFDWQLNFTLSRNRIKDFVEMIYEDEWDNPIAIPCGDTPIAFSPDFTLHNAFNFNVAGFDASLETQYVGRQFMNNARSAEAELPSYCVSNLHLGYTFRNILSVKSMRVGLSVYNLFNKKYFNNGYAGAGYTIGESGKPEIYRYAGYSAQATTNVMATVNLQF